MSRSRLKVSERTEDMKVSSLPCTIDVGLKPLQDQFEALDKSVGGIEPFGFAEHGTPFEAKYCVAAENDMTVQWRHCE